MSSSSLEELLRCMENASCPWQDLQAARSNYWPRGGVRPHASWPMGIIEGHPNSVLDGAGQNSGRPPGQFAAVDADSSLSGGTHTVVHLTPSSCALAASAARTLTFPAPRPRRSYHPLGVLHCPLLHPPGRLRFHPALIAPAEPTATPTSSTATGDEAPPGTLSPNPVAGRRQR